MLESKLACVLLSRSDTPNACDGISPELISLISETSSTPSYLVLAAEANYIEFLEGFLGLKG